MNSPTIIALALLGSLVQIAHASDTYVFTDVTVLPMTGEAPIERTNVWVAGQRIRQIGQTHDLKRATLARPLTRIDGTGLFLMPGLTEMHGHLPPLRAGADSIREVLFLFLANGVTTVRGMLGHPGHLRVRDQISSGELLGPTLYLAGPGFSGGNVASPQAGADRISQQKAAGWDLAKIYPGLTEPEYAAIAAQARSVGFEFSGHIPQSIGLRKALAAGQRTIEHLDGFVLAANGRNAEVPEERWVQLAKLTREAGAGVVPTMAVWETLLGVPSPDELAAYPELKYVSANLRQSWRDQYASKYSQRHMRQLKAILGGPNNEIIAANRKRLLGVLYREGVEILFGTDAPQLYSVPGFANIREMNHMLEAGMPIPAILRSATSSPGQYYKDKDKFGTVEPGARADLLLLREDPRLNLATLTQPVGVMVRGQWLDSTRIQQGLETISARHR